MQSKKDFACWRAIDKLHSGSLYHLHLDPSRNPVTTTCGHRSCYCSWSEKAACVAWHQRPCARAWKQWCQPPSVLPLKDSVHMLLHHTEKRNSGVKQQISSQHKIKVSVLRELGDGTGHQWPHRMKDAALDKLANKEHRNTLLELFLILTFQSVYRHIRHQYREYLNVIMARGTLQEMLSEKWTNHCFLYFFIPKYAEARLTLRLWCHSRPDVDHMSAVLFGKGQHWIWVRTGQLLKKSNISHITHYFSLKSCHGWMGWKLISI